MNRYGFETPANYNDHELYCGGYSRQHQRNGGKCGVCGDAWDLPRVSIVRVQSIINSLEFYLWIFSLVHMKMAVLTAREWSSRVTELALTWKLVLNWRPIIVATLNFVCALWTTSWHLKRTSALIVTSCSDLMAKAPVIIRVRAAESSSDPSINFRRVCSAHAVSSSGVTLPEIIGARVPTEPDQWVAAHRKNSARVPTSESPSLILRRRSTPPRSRVSLEYHLSISKSTGQQQQQQQQQRRHWPKRQRLAQMSLWPKLRP